jgi:hypothetical protein
MKSFPSFQVALLVTAATLLSLPSCLGPAFDSSSGEAAEERGDLVTAREWYFETYLRARKSTDHKATAYAVYEYARVSGYAGDTRVSEEAFGESFKMIEASSGRADKLRAPARSEYARFLNDQGRYREAAAQFKIADAELQTRDIERIDPIGYAELLEEYRATLAKSGQASQAAKIGAKEKSLRARHPAQSARFKPKPYPRKLQPGHRLYGPLNG